MIERFFLHRVYADGNRFAEVVGLKRPVIIKTTSANAALSGLETTFGGTKPALDFPVVKLFEIQGVVYHFWK